MGKNNEKRLCWNCDAGVSLHMSQCPYCGVDLSRPTPEVESQHSPYQGAALGDPFQKAPDTEDVRPLYPKEFTLSEDEWDEALEKKKESDEESPVARKKELVALLLLLPGVVFLLFGLLLLFFSKEGTLTLKWNQSMAYFYFLGAIPLIWLGWRAISRK